MANDLQAGACHSDCNSNSSSDIDDCLDDFHDAYDWGGAASLSAMAAPAVDPAAEAAANQMNFQKAMEEAQTAIDFFFDNKFTEAKELMTPWASTSMYHAAGEGVFAFLSATLTFDRELMAEANAKLKNCLTLCNSKRKKRRFGETFGNIVKRHNYDSYTDEEAHAELCYSEVLLLKAILTFMEDEELLSLVKGSLKIKQCFNGYKECANVLRERHWTDQLSKDHFQSGVRMGIGSFNLLISLLPGRVIKLLEFVGFSGDKAQGLSELLQGYQQDAGLRQVLCVMTLLGYYLIICYVITDQPGDLVLCEQILNNQLENYPNGVWFKFFKGRLEYMKGNLEDAVTWYKKAWRSQVVWPQFHHICFWELAWIHCTRQEWREAMLYCDYLTESSRWSRTIYSYQKAAVMCMIYDDLSDSEKMTCQNLMAEAPTHKQRIAGKSLPMEKFVIKRCKKYAAQNGHLLLPAIELMYLWNMFRVFRNNMRAGDKMLRLIEEVEKKGVRDVDEKALILLLKGSTLRHLGATYQARMCLDTLIGLKKQLKEDHHLIPYGIVEIGLLFNNMGERAQAIGALEDVKKNYSGYSLESRLHFRIHMALSSLRE